MGFSVIRAGDRSLTQTDWLSSRHSFSFGDHYDPDNTHHGALIASNEENLPPGCGFDAHHHQESEIVTWVTSGSLVHRDSAGNAGVVYPGLAQRMSAGHGVDHSERNDPWPDLPGSGTETAHYVQMWILPDEHGTDPSYAQQDISADLATGGLVAVASGDPAHGAAIPIANRGATLYAARPPAGRHLTLPAARFTHVFVVRGELTVADATGGRFTLGPGDAARGRDTGGEDMTAETDAEVLIWAMDRALGEF
ncbi:pirin family protein [Gordonia sp. NB41Y]|uniref:pirin family protein n=1 Tax=Gordonia sp. NB41Y TaxID=875808 RepID=UPI0006B21013|nr:pirin family protein [Gordonia sp. NB41Y]KOY49957.1 quercetin 2,3-dioxygenase [Gordonia sp. NB41Y]WLP88910.1 pirin family protein [Gordonia sp. NB41Y]